MTTIKSSAYLSGRLLDVIPRSDGLVNLNINHAGFNCSIQIPTHKLLEALDAVPNHETEALRADFGRMHERALAAEAKLSHKGHGCNAAIKDELLEQVNAAEAKLKHVRKEAREMRGNAKKATSSEATFVWNQAAAWIEAALADEPEFVLPTKDGARFEATSANGNVYQFESFTAFGITYYFANQLVWTANQVMGMFTDHRLIEGEA